LGWVNKDIDIKVTKYYNINFSISVDFVDEVVFDVVSMDMCGVVFGSLYMSMRDEVFM
jgi:hypothetical protein